MIIYMFKYVDKTDVKIISLCYKIERKEEESREVNTIVCTLLRINTPYFIVLK
jgi:hypothetical protein